VLPGCANFLLCQLPRDAGTAVELIAACRERGLFLRDVSSMGTTFDAHALRITVKDADTNDRMLDIIESVSRLRD
jgi:histidinol-phosphate/aromatic aminotransferase/cobyric acid decarboxylase-like protein